MREKFNFRLHLVKTGVFALSFFNASPSHAEITDNCATLIVPAGETYTLDGTHSYSDFIRIDGTLSVSAYNGSGVTGTLTLAASSMTIGLTGEIIADGRGYPPGSGPGKGPDGAIAGGGSYGGIGGSSTGPVYGSLTNPMDLGSGGGYQISGSTFTGGAGGGLIRLNITGVLTVDGVISADGTRGPDYKCSGGSGGSVNIAASDLTGAGVIKAGGGYGLYNGGGGGGRIAITAPANAFTGTVTAYGSESSYDHPGGPGSVLINGDLAFDNGGISGHTEIPGTNYSAAEISKIIIRSGSMADFQAGAVFEGALEITAATVAVNDTLTIGPVIVNSGGVVAPKQHKIDLIVKSSMTVAAGGMVLADGMGYPSGSGPGRGNDGPYGGGGSYGGQGGGSNLPPYGSLINPVDFGSGGGYQISDSSYPGGAGGGFVRLSVSEDLTVDGAISANGTIGTGDFVGGGGSGGGINITSGRLIGSGLIRANGNYGYNSNSGGGGGRIAAYYGQKIFTGNITVAGGGSTGGFVGENGSIVDNGAIISGGTLGPGESITAPSQTIGSARPLTEDISEESMAFNNLAASGTFSGAVSFPQLAIVRINSGAYAGKGFARGALSAILDGKPYLGSFEGSAFLQGGAISLRGLATGDIYGSVELELTEAIPGSGIYNKVGGLINCNRIGNIVLAKLYVSGEGTRISGQSYPAVKLSLTQTAVQGNMTGDYAGPFNAIFTGITIDDHANPHNGKGYSLASYSTDKGEATGWTYANRFESGIISVTGMLASPLYALVQGVFNSNINPPKFILNTEKLDNSLLALTVRTSQPYGVSPGGTYSFGIVVNNQGTTTFENMSVVVVAPPHMAFESASSTYTFHSSVYWTNDAYDPIPCLRWDFPQITPGQIINLGYELKVRIGVAFNGEMMKGQVYILPTQDALEFLPVYDDAGPTDDDVIEDADLPVTGVWDRIVPLSIVIGTGY